jgi:hypothetical protein
VAQLVVPVVDEALQRDLVVEHDKSLSGRVAPAGRP